jgi:hypothetical protein
VKGLYHIFRYYKGYSKALMNIYPELNLQREKFLHCRRFKGVRGQLYDLKVNAF